MKDTETSVKDAGAEYAEIWGEAIHSNRHLRVLSVGLGIGLLLLIIVVIRIVSVDPPRPIVVRVDEVGRAEAIAYEAMEAQADPLDPTTKYFLNRFIYDFYSRRRATVQENWSRSLRFLTTELANASFRAESQNIALLAAGAAKDELQVDRVVLRIQANPQEPHSATADFDLVRMVMANEVSRERWTLSLQFQFLDDDPAGPDRPQPYGDRHQLSARRPGDSHRRSNDDRALAGTGTEAGSARLDGPGSGVDRAGVPSQRRLHAPAVLSSTLMLRAKRPSLRPSVGCTAGSGRERKLDVQSGGARPCRISSKPIYRALGVENIRHRRKARPPVVMRRLLSLDFVLEHPGMNWLPAEPEKVAFFEKLGLSRRLIPRRIYYGAVGAQKRYFALKLPIASGPRNRHLRLRRSGPPNGSGVALLGSRAWAALGCAPQEGAAGPGDRDRSGE